MADNAVTGPGVCQGMGTANTMHIAAEALGMTMPDASPARANGPRMWRSVDGAGRRIVEMVREGLRPRDVLTAGQLPQRGDGDAVGQRVDQQRQAPSGDRG